MFSSGTLALRGAEVPVPFLLIRHPEGDVVVDGGNPLAVARDVRAHWGEPGRVAGGLDQADRAIAGVIEVVALERLKALTQLIAHPQRGRRGASGSAVSWHGEVTLSAGTTGYSSQPGRTSPVS